MTSSEVPADAVPLADAIVEFAEKEQLQEWQELNAELKKQGPIKRQILLNLDGTPVENPETVYLRKRRANRRHQAEKCWQGLTRSLVRKLIRGELIGWGREGTVTGPHRRIPSEAWTYIKLFPGSRARVVEGQQIYSISIAPSACEPAAGLNTQSTPTAGGTKKSAKKLCSIWLAQLDDLSRLTKAEVFKIVKMHFTGLGPRQFDKVWETEAPDRWKKAGARKSDERSAAQRAIQEAECLAEAIAKKAKTKTE